MTKQTQVRKLEKQLDSYVEYAESRRKGSKIRALYYSYADQIADELKWLVGY